MKSLKDGNWGLKFLALLLAIVLYHVMKSENSHSTHDNERNFLRQYR